MLTDTLAIIIIVSLICIVILYYALMGTINIKDHTNSINYTVETFPITSSIGRLYYSNILLLGIPIKYNIDYNKLETIIKLEIENSTLFKYFFKANCKFYSPLDLNYNEFLDAYEPLKVSGIVNYKLYQKINNKQLICLYLYSKDDKYNDLINDLLNSLGTTLITSIIEGELTPSI